MNEIPQVVAELLAPIPGGSPTGVDDLSTVEAYVKLEAEMSKPAPNYANCMAWATQVLRSNSKNMRVATWLGFTWYRTEKFAGLKNGVLLAAELLERYQDKLFPANSGHRVKALQVLSSEKVTRLLAKETVTPQTAQDVDDLKAALKRLTAICSQQFPQNGPNLTALAQVIDTHLKAAPEQQKANGKRQAASDEQPTKTSGQEAATRDQHPERVSEPATPTGAASDQLQQNEASAASGQQSSEPEIEIPGEVAELLKPISAKAPAGKDLANAHEPDYFTLKSEIAKVRPDYDKCIALAGDLLKSQTKDIEIMLSLCFAWYRKENIIGLKNGLLLLLKALQQFSDKLYPSDPGRRGKAFNFLTTKQVAKMLAKERVTEINAKAIVVLNEVFQQFQKEFLKRFPPEADKSGRDSRPSFLKEFEETLKGHVKDAEELLKPPPEKKTEPRLETPVSEAPGKQGTPETTTKPPGDKSPTSGSTTTTIASDKDALAAMRKALVFFFEAQVNGKKIRKIPEDASLYGLSRQLQWSKLATLPPAKEGVTDFDGPPKEKQAAIRKLFADKNWEEMIPEIEARFLDTAVFRLWLDAQRFVVTALEAKGGKAQPAADEIKFQLARLANRVPGLPKLKFKDKTTAFADNETVQWIEDEVKGMLGKGKTTERILPPIMGEEYEAINKEYEAACAELPENFEKNAETMQKAMTGDLRRKGRFLRALNLANFSITAKKPELARALLQDLAQKIEAYQLAEWEPALCVAVWQSTYLNNLKLLRPEAFEAQKPALERQQEELYLKISNYDCLLALALTSRQPKEGE